MLFCMSARANDASFRSLFEPHRRSITLHCYRMLGSLQDAEEIVQESLLRAWQRRDEVRSTDALRAWLYKIATNACLDELRKSRRRRSLPHLVATPATEVRLGAPADDWHWVEPAPDSLLDAEDDAGRRPDARVSRLQSIGLAFITALQLLSPKQRAALLMVDVLGWQPQETATLLETSVASVNSLLQRARKSVATRSEEGAPQPVTDSDAALLQRFIATWESGDLDAFTALLADDALLSMPPQPEWYLGREAVRQFFGVVWERDSARRRLLPLAANGGLAVAVYRRPLTSDAPYEPSGITLVTIRSGRIAQLTRFGSLKLFPLFGLTTQLAV
jgi:RNA polymerase sigma-70 factor (ECF subfamily)